MICAKCGGTGLDIHNDYCDCEIGQKKKAEAHGTIIKPDYVPDGYGAEFESSLMKSPYDDKLGKFMDELYKQIIETKSIPQNCLICMPPNSGKSFFMYSILTRLNSFGICQQPRTITELEEIIRQNSNIWTQIKTAPIFFLRIESVFPLSFVQTISTLIYERTQVNNKTILLADTSWNIITKRFPTMTNFEGNGYLKTFVVKE